MRNLRAASVDGVFSFLLLPIGTLLPLPPTAAPFLVERKPLSDNLQGFSPSTSFPAAKGERRDHGPFEKPEGREGNQKVLFLWGIEAFPNFHFKEDIFFRYHFFTMLLALLACKLFNLFFLFWQTSPCLTANASRHGKRERGGVISFLPSFSSTSGAAVFGIDRVKTLRFPRKESI